MADIEWDISGKKSCSELGNFSRQKDGAVQQFIFQKMACGATADPIFSRKGCFVVKKKHI